MFDLDNTEGYTQQDCDDLNVEFQSRFDCGEWGDDRDLAEKWFSDEVSKR